MTFTTLSFAYFMAVTFLIYYIIPNRFKWMVLLVANTYFYYQTGLRGFLFLIGTIVVSYLFGLLIEKTGSKIWCIWLTIVLFVGMMCVMRTSVGSLIMPLGLSFYSMQCIGYCIEVHRGSTKAEKNIFKYATYISFFPHVLQGPFADYNELKEEIFRPHPFNYSNAVRGMYRFTYGLMKKLVLADRISYVINTVYENSDAYYGMTVLLVMFLYAIQLYADFSGYMDMAQGAALLLDIKMRENFNVPYMSKSMAEFWRRWHISLGLWFKNYVFYPVQRTDICTKIRKSMKKKGNKYAMNVLPSVIGLTCVWTLIGLWHGFDWNYLLYDWICGLIIIFSELMKPIYDKVNNVAPRFFKSKPMDALRIVRTFVLVSFTFLLFRPDTVEISMNMFKNLFSGIGVKTMFEFMYWHSYDLFLVVVPLIIVTVVDALKYREIDVCERFHKMNFLIRYSVYILGILLIYITKGDLSEVAFAYSVF